MWRKSKRPWPLQPSGGSSKRGSSLEWESMKQRSEKQKDLDELKSDLAKVSTVILTTFQGITVEEDTKLRRAVQSAGGRYRVVKNTLAERAGAGTPAESLLKGLTGPHSIAFTAADP